MKDWADILRAVEAGGTFTPEFVAWLRALVAEVKALREAATDHEARIEALEP